MLDFGVTWIHAIWKFTWEQQKQQPQQQQQHQRQPYALPSGTLHAAYPYSAVNYLRKPHITALRCRWSFFFCISTHISIRFAYAYNASDNANTQTGRRTTATTTTKIDTVCLSRLLLLLFFLLFIIQCVLIRCVSVRRHDLTWKIVKTPFDSLESVSGCGFSLESVGKCCVALGLFR